MIRAESPVGRVGRRVLIVDDESSIARSTAALLEDLGHETMLVLDADEIAPESIRFQPHVVLQDARMPGLRLDDALEHYARLVPAPRVVLFSADLEIREIASRFGVSDWIEKPFKVHDLERVVEAASP